MSLTCFVKRWRACCKGWVSLKRLDQTSGARVGIKPNLTGAAWDGTGKPPATELFVTHPAVVNALGEVLLDMGVGKLVIMDGIADETSFDKWGYTAMAKPLGAATH